MHQNNSLVKSLYIPPESIDMNTTHDDDCASLVSKGSDSDDLRLRLGIIRDRNTSSSSACSQNATIMPRWSSFTFLPNSSRNKSSSSKSAVSVAFKRDMAISCNTVRLTLVGLWSPRRRVAQNNPKNSNFLCTTKLSRKLWRRRQH